MVLPDFPPFPFESLSPRLSAAALSRTGACLYSLDSIDQAPNIDRVPSPLLPSPVFIPPYKPPLFVALSTRSVPPLVGAGHQGLWREPSRICSRRLVQSSLSSTQFRPRCPPVRSVALAAGSPERLRGRSPGRCQIFFCLACLPELCILFSLPAFP